MQSRVLPRKRVCVVSEVLSKSMLSAPRSDCVERAKPALALKALVMFSEGCGFQEIRDATGLGMRTLQRLRDDHRKALDEEREKMAYRVAEDTEYARDLLRRRLEQLGCDTEELAKQSPKELATVFGILVDKSERLADRATVRVEVESGPRLSDVGEMRAALREKLAKGRVVDVESHEDAD